MKHCGTKIIETDRLILRLFQKNDATNMFTNWASDPEVTKYLRWPPHQSIEESKKILASWISSYSKDNYYQWAITLKNENHTLIGSIGIVEQNEKINSALIGYCIGQKWWRKGYTSEALSAVITYLFDTVGFNRIESSHNVLNPNSGFVMKKCGMKYEGTHRSGDWDNQGICDSSVYSILQSDRI